MARRTTKRDEILTQWQRAVAEAERERDDARAEADRRQIVYEARKEAMESLQRTLAPKPRQQPAATKGAGKRRAGKGRQPSDAVIGACADCAMAEDMPVHSPEGGYQTYHPFRPRTSAPTARNQSPPNGVGAGPGASLGTVTVGAGNAARVVSEGE